MADIVFNIALGEVKTLAGLPAANDAIIVVVLEATGLVADSIMRDYDTLDDIIAGASNEQATMGRKTVTSVSVTVNDTNDRVEVDIADQVWTAAAGNAVGALVMAYDGDTTGGTDANIKPLTKHGFAVTPDGSDITATIADFYRATSAA